MSLNSSAVSALQPHGLLSRWFIPERLQQKPLELSRAHNVISASVIAAMSGPFYAFFYHFLGFDAATYVILASCVVMFTAPFIVKSTGNIKAAEAAFVSAVFFNFTWLTYHLGGVTAPTTPWLILCPLVAMFLGGVRTGLFWLLMSSTSLVSIYLLEINGLSAPPAPISDPILLYVLCNIGLLVVVVIFAVLFELAKTQGFTKLERALSTIQELAIRDELTGTNNRRHLLKLIEDQKELISRAGGVFCLCLLDIDHFKRINDTFGHSTGDKVLKLVSQAVQGTIRTIDSFGRYGGEEFLIMLPQTSLDDSLASAERVRVAIEQLESGDLPPDLKVTVSIGIAEFRSGETVSQLIARSDQALYQAKFEGRNRIITYDSLSQLDDDSAFLDSRSGQQGDSRSLLRMTGLQKQMLNSAKLSRAHGIESILGSMPDGVAVISKDGECLPANATAQRLISLSARQAAAAGTDGCGLFMPDGVTPYLLVQHLVEKVMQGEYVENAEMLVRDPDAEGPAWFRCSARPILENGERILGAVAIFRDITDGKEHERKTREIKEITSAQYDALTGLPNRHVFRDRLAHAMHRAIRNHHMIALMTLDINKFKELNDALGYETGDEALVQVADRIKRCLRDCDTVSRWDGDEFIIILEDVLEEADACTAAQKIIDGFADPLMLDRTECFLSLCIGIILFPVQDIDIDSLLKKADIAKQRAKNLGQNNFVVYSQDMTVAAIERLTLKNQLRRALYRNELFLQYQPQVDIKTNKIVGVEALVRWQHPEFGFIAPAQFIPLAEETGMIIAIGEWVLRTACLQNVAWRDAGLPPIKVAVNLSACQLKHPGLVESVRRIVRETAIDPTCVDLEITEGILIEDLQFSRRVISELRELGIKISIDDFGTGYSSLSYLSELPLDILKMDGSFVRRLAESEHDETSHSIAEAIILMAHNLNLVVVAEAVETSQQLASLRRMDCDQLQGFLFSRPLASYGVATLLRRQSLAADGNAGTRLVTASAA